MSSFRLLSGVGSDERLSRVARVLLWIAALIFAYKMVRITLLEAETPSGIDFLYFWDSARHVVEGNAAQAYSARVTPLTRLAPLAYPPPFLLLIWPLGLVDYGTAIVLWLTMTGTIFWFSSRQPLPLVLTNPGAGLNVYYGQTSFVTGAFFLGGMSSLGRPVVAGLLLGGLVIKPHLALLIPLALAAGGYWRTFAYAGLSSAVLIVAAAVVFEPAIYIAWWNSLSQYGEWLVDGAWRWQFVSSFYGLLRWCGVPFGPAMGGHLVVAAGAAYLVWKSWREQWSCKAEIAAAATLLASPYLFSYDSILLIAPIGWLWTRDKGAALAVWSIAMLPLAATSLLGIWRWVPWILQLPSTIPIASLLALALLVRNEKLQRGSENRAPSATTRRSDT